MVVISLFGYGLLLTAIITHRHLRTYTNRLIVALSISDVLNLISTLLSSLLGPVASSSEYNCLLMYAPAFGFPLISMNLFTVIAGERYASVFWPLRYHQIVTWRRLVVAIVLSYTFGIILSLPPLLGWNNIKEHEVIGFKWTFPDCYQFLVFRGDYLCLIHVITLFESITVTVIYVKILILAKKHAKKLWKQRQVVGASHLNIPSKIQEDSVGERNQTGNYTVKQTTARGVKILFFLIVIYVTTKFPMKICNAIQYRFWTKQSIFALNVSQDFFTWSVLLSQSNSVLYPFIYALANKDIFTVLKRKLCCKRCDSAQCGNHGASTSRENRNIFQFQTSL